MIPKTSTEDFESRKREIRSKFESAWSNIIDKYSSYSLEDQGDIVDIATGKVVEDNGHVRALENKRDPFRYGESRKKSITPTKFGMVVPEDQSTDGDNDGDIIKIGRRQKTGESWRTGSSARTRSSMTPKKLIGRNFVLRHIFDTPEIEPDDLDILAPQKLPRTDRLIEELRSLTYKPNKQRIRVEDSEEDDVPKSFDHQKVLVIQEESKNFSSRETKSPQDNEVRQEEQEVGISFYLNSENSGDEAIELDRGQLSVAEDSGYFGNDDSFCEKDDGIINQESLLDASFLNPQESFFNKTQESLLIEDESDHFLATQNNLFSDDSESDIEVIPAEQMKSQQFTFSQPSEISIKLQAFSQEIDEIFESPKKKTKLH